METDEYQPVDDDPKETVEPAPEAPGSDVPEEYEFTDWALI